MFAGHFGVAAAVKAKNPEIPLWSLMLSTQLLDVAFIPFLLTGGETIELVDGSGYGHALIHADYTHSLAGALLIAALAAIVAGRAWGRRSGLVIGQVVMSHWLLDLLVHRADMPLLPGNLGGLPLLGLGVWRWPGASATVEALLIMLGGILYARSTWLRAQGANRLGNTFRVKGKAITASLVMGTLLILSLLQDVFGLLA